MSGNGDFISREAVNQIIAARCGECADARLESIGFLPDCDQCLLHVAKKAIESIPAADVRPKWISVEERLPEDRQSVLVHRDDGGIFIFEYFTTSPTDECWIDDHLNVYSAYSVTHWMPLPEPPKEEILA